MNEISYDYCDMITTYWDLLRGKTSKWSSRPCFLEIIWRSGQPALDVACGTERLLLDDMDEGVDIDGVELSPDRIAAASANCTALGPQPNLFKHGMQDLDLPAVTKRFSCPHPPSCI